MSSSALLKSTTCLAPVAKAPTARPAHRTSCFSVEHTVSSRCIRCERTPIPCSTAAHFWLLPPTRPPRAAPHPTSLPSPLGRPAPFTAFSPSRASRASARACVAVSAAPKSFDALIFDCDGVIVESEDIHRRAYNAAFEHFDVRCPGQSGPIVWSVEFYDMLQNKVGGGKPKMRWYFGENGWPTSTVLDGREPGSEEDKTQLVDVLQAWKTEKYKDIIGE